MFWSIVSWIILGALAGWIATSIVPTEEHTGGVTNVVVGIIGAVIGGLILRLFGATPPSGFSLGSLLMAILGAVILLWIVRAVQRGMH